MQANTAVKS